MRRMARLSAAAIFGALAATDGATAASSPAFAAPPASSGVRVAGSGGSAASAVGRCQVGSAFMGKGMSLARRTCPKKSSSGGRGGSTELKAFLGQDSGILGVGAPEVAVIVLVGYFILGPTDLYKLVKEIGKTIQNVRTLGVEASKSFENTMEDQLELQELRKAQQELNDAFSFRRSINVEEDSYFSEGSPEAKAVETVTATTTATAVAAATETGAPAKKKIKRRRRIKKKVEPAPEEAAAIPPVANDGNVPDLDMTDAFAPVKPEPAAAPVDPAPTPVPVSAEAGSADWFKEQKAVPEQFGGSYEAAGTGEDAYEQDRFAAQLSGNWNQQILDNEDKLSPLSKVMERLAILEEEKLAADRRLEEEFRFKAELEEKFYEEKRKLLEDAAAEVQAEAYASMAEAASNKTEAKSTTA